MKRKILSTIVIVLSILLLSACSVELRAKVDYISPNAYEQLRIEMIAEAEKAVIAVKTDSGHGSGIIYKVEEVSTDPVIYRYYAMTNYHVIEDAGEIKIHFGNTRDDITALDVAGNQNYDIAVVRFETNRVLDVHTVLAFQKNEENQNQYLEILKGQDVYAIGTPQDISRFNYVTQGIVSLPSITYNNIPGLAFMHDAELNPGNSGGPMFNLNGDLIGINVAKISNISTSEGVIAAEGLNYTLSINALSTVVLGFEDDDFSTVIRKPRLGVTVVNSTDFLADEQYDPSLIPSDTLGIVVVDFDYTRNAHLVLELYDLIIEMNGVTVQTKDDIAAQLADAEFGDEHTLKVLRKVNDQFVEFTVTIELSWFQKMSLIK